ncbi:hypothetical protein MN032_17240 [Agromyces atrinae]|uniref:hypothetical protein n=1 Tax=Agromyces atrinae TaxID=592376 RepID=UPI001F5A95F9|nr:hypothetical protein [Agromyces atrinae]MCI2959432.1 hypothetical protein [Agromyces atrinae]
MQINEMTSASEGFLEALTDEDVQVREAAYFRRDIPTEYLERALEIHPEDASLLAFHHNAPVSALLQKPIGFLRSEELARIVEELSVTLAEEAALREKITQVLDSPLQRDAQISTAFELLRQIRMGGTH